MTESAQWADSVKTEGGIVTNGRVFYQNLAIIKIPHMGNHSISQSERIKEPIPVKKQRKKRRGAELSLGGYFTTGATHSRLRLDICLVSRLEVLPSKIPDLNTFDAFPSVGHTLLFGITGIYFVHRHNNFLTCAPFLFTVTKYQSTPKHFSFH